MPDRYWVGGTANWDGTAGTKWAATSGGAGGASVPTSADDVYFDAASGAVTVTLDSFRSCRSLNFTGFTGTISSTAFGVNIFGSLVLSPTMTITGAAFSWTLLGATTGKTITSNGKTLTGQLNFDATGGSWSLSDALVCSSSITVTSGTFTTNNFNVTATQLSSSNSNTRTINLGSSTVTLSSTVPITFTTSTNLTFNAGTSSIVCSATSMTFNGGGMTFRDVNLSATTGTNLVMTITGANTYNNFTRAGRSANGVTTLTFNANQTINGTLRISPGGNALQRNFFYSDVIGITRTFFVNNFAAGSSDVDFRDIAITGPAAPISGTRFSDCKGNSGITFPAPKTVWWGGSNVDWVTGPFALTNGGATAANNMPLAQDTLIFPSSPTPFPASGAAATIGSRYSLGTVDLSARTTSFPMTFSQPNGPAMYGNWIGGNGVTITGTNPSARPFTFAGRGNQTVISAGVAFSYYFEIATPGGSVTFLDAFATTRAVDDALNIISGTLNANGYNVTAQGLSVASGTLPRQIDIGAGTWTLTGASAWNAAASSNLTITGTGTISLTSSSAKDFRGGDIQTYPTINQGGVGTLTITGSNRFANITNTAIGRVQFTGGTTNIFNAFNISGVSGTLMSLGSTNTTQAILQKGSAWLMGANSTDAGNNTNLSFTAGGGIDYLSVSYINGTVVAPPATVNSNFFAFF